MPILDENKLHDELHALCGLCGHCGKKDCAGRQSHGKLPKTLSTDQVLEAIERARVK